MRTTKEQNREYCDKIVNVLSKKVIDIDEKITWKSVIKDVQDILIEMGYKKDDAKENAEYIVSFGLRRIENLMFINLQPFIHFSDAILRELDLGVSRGNEFLERVRSVNNA